MSAAKGKVLIIVTGGPGTGKSVTSQKILESVESEKIVKISYDSIKEKEWDRFGFDNLKEKDELNAWSLEEFYLILKKEMWLGKNILIEYPFYQRHKEKLRELVSNYAYRAISIYLYTDLKTMYIRGVERDQNDNRHPGHLLLRYHIEDYLPEMITMQNYRSQLTFEEFKETISKKNYDIDLGIRIPIDVTNFNDIPYKKIAQTILNCIGNN
ncbi:MAG: AAA family ATPase [Bilifractor sp.]